jgi:hypothetical protein
VCQVEPDTSIRAFTYKVRIHLRSSNTEGPHDCELQVVVKILDGQYFNTSIVLRSLLEFGNGAPPITGSLPYWYVSITGATLMRPLDFYSIRFILFVHSLYCSA